MIHITKNEQETEQIGYNLAKTARQGAVFCVRGELGAGKTVFARGFARGLGINGKITSPTFCIVNEYTTGRIPFCHFDAYRVNASEMEGIGFDDYLNGVNCCLIEWPENIQSLVPASAQWIRIRVPEPGSGLREITIGELLC